MFLGGDQYKNHSSNNLILKCHICGDTDLRLVGSNRTGDKDRPYVCGNDHETWGAIDDYSIPGQTDVLFNRVSDCCCEGTECEFPESIFVNFSGLIGVQARESKNDSEWPMSDTARTPGQKIFYDIRTREGMPLSICASNPIFTQSECNGPWTYGQKSADGICINTGGDCDCSDDRNQKYNYTTQVCEVVEYAQGCEEQNRDSWCRTYGTIASLSPTPPGQLLPVTGCSGPFEWKTTTNLTAPPGGTGPSCCTSLILKYGPDYFPGSAPQVVGGGPTFLQRLSATIMAPGCGGIPGGWMYFNGGGPGISDACAGGAGDKTAPSLLFLTISKYAVVKDPSTCSCNNTSQGCKVYFSQEIKIVYRVHPTSDPLTAPPNPEGWTIDDASTIGGQDSPSSITVVCSNGSTKAIDGSYEDSGAPDCPVTLPVSANFCINCSCNDCTDTPTMQNCSDAQKARTIWPFRIPAYESAGYGDTYWQLFRDDSTYDDYPTAHQCDGGCNNICNVIDEYEPCCETRYYPSCFALGTTKCNDEDSKYRIDCSPPDDYFTTFLNDDAIRNLFQYRHTGNYNGINIKPIFDSTINNHSKWRFPNHPDVVKCGTAQAGFVVDYNDPKTASNPCPLPIPCGNWNQVNNRAIYGATGVRQVLGGSINKKNETVAQPHCLRRVKNPNLHDNILYAVNTADVSDQTIILDRYYPTASNTDYLWKDYPLALDNNSEQPFVNNKGDLGITDYQKNRFFPYPFIANSGSNIEPELIAIILSQSGVGGQVAFATIPTSYDTDILVDPGYDGNIRTGQVPDFTARGSCRFKHRITVHGYSVMYPFIDDPIWREGINVTPSGFYRYPVILPGSGYAVGDKIEFRCWKTLEDSESRFDEDGNPIQPDDPESIWGEECLESIIATATISVVDNNGGIIWYDFDEKDDNDDYLIFVGNCPCDYDQCKEPSPFDPVTGDRKCTNDVELDQCIGCVSKVCYPSGHAKIDALPDGFPGFPAEVCTYQGGLIQTVDENCSYYIPGGCYADNNAYAYCNQQCSATFAPGNIPSSLVFFVPNESACDSSNCYCLGNDDWTEYNPGTNPSFNPLAISFKQGDDFDDWYNSKDVGDIENGTCICNKHPPANDSDPFWQNYIGPWQDEIYVAGLEVPGDWKCFPLNRSWEFFEPNFARCACSGEPITPEYRPHLVQDYIDPPKRAQWKAEWFPAVNCFIQNIPEYIYFSTVDQLNPNQVELEQNAVIDEFLSSHEACNPLKIDRFGRSYKFPQATITSEFPCRKFDQYNALPSGITADNYCRAYGFYQQRQPSCEVKYRGQYIMRAAQKNPLNNNDYNRYTDCEPIIENIEITLSKKEARFDVSVGAPYEQDYLIPENLPTPIAGPDGKLECTADAWNSPSLSGINNTRFFDFGFFEPNRYSKLLAEITDDSANISDLIPVLKVTQQRSVIDPSWGPYPTTESLTFTMPEIDGKDFDTTDIYITGVWDIPDPRSNCRSSVPQLNCGQPCNNPVYNPEIGLPATGTRHSFINDCQYPWERIDNEDHYCMFKNNSAHIILDEIEECSYCVGTTLLTTNDSVASIKSFPIKIDGVLSQVDENDFLLFIHYTDTRLVDVTEITIGDDTKYVAEYIVFQGFADTPEDSPTLLNMIQSFKDVIDKYINVWVNRTDVNAGDSDGQKLLDSFNDDTHLSILFNMLFEGTSDAEISKLMRVDIYKLTQTTDERANYTLPYKVNGIGPDYTLELISKEDRCKRRMDTGSIKSMKVMHPGKGYAFEIEERVPPSSVVQSIPNGQITITSKVKDSRRRLETYQLNNVEIEHNGNGYNIGDVINISFNDSNFRRDEIYITTQPSITVTDVDDGQITDWTISNSGEYYKYVGTGQHRAFPVAIVANNYWNHLDNNSSEIGRHAKLRAVVGVDPTDTNTYGRIKRVVVEFGGINYMVPTTYWTIDTKMGTYDSYGELSTGLDIQHLVNPCKYTDINGDGLNSDQIALYADFMLNPYYENLFPETLYLPDQMGDPDDKFKYSVKHYLHTGADSNRNIIKWSDKAQHWSTVAFSGSCPFASGGLLDRSYQMALIEENLMYSMLGAAINQSPVQPLIGICPNSVCSDIIDINDPVCTANSAYNPSYPNEEPCGGYCDTYTAFDAHRFPYDSTNGFISSAFVNTRPYVKGCFDKIPLDTQARRDTACWNTGGATGGVLRTDGYVNWPMISNANDKCANAEYSMFLEIGKYLDPIEDDPGAPPVVLPVSRAKTITYKMKDPISMRISFNDQDHSEYLGTLACPSGEYNDMTLQEKVSYVACSGCSEE